MSSQLQLFVYEGYLGKEPEMRYTPSGRAVTNFSVGSTSQYTNSTTGEVVKTTTWFRVTAWGGLAEIISKYCDKGSHVIVTGVLKPGPDGRPVVFAEGKNGPTASYEVTASSVRILKGKDGAAVESSADLGDEDIPF